MSDDPAAGRKFEGFSPSRPLILTRRPRLQLASQDNHPSGSHRIFWAIVAFFGLALIVTAAALFLSSCSEPGEFVQVDKNMAHYAPPTYQFHGCTYTRHVLFYHYGTPRFDAQGQARSDAHFRAADEKVGAVDPNRPPCPTPSPPLEVTA